MFCFLGFGSALQAQNCTVAQKAACQKICSAKKSCTAAEKALCKAVCSNAKTVAVVEKKNCAKKCAVTSCLKMADAKPTEAEESVATKPATSKIVKTVALKEN